MLITKREEGFLHFGTLAFLIAGSVGCGSSFRRCTYY